MDFEVLTEKTRPLTLMGEWERLLTSRKVALQQWVKLPPHRLGLAIFFLVTFELLLGSRLMSEAGLNRSALMQWLKFGILILALELVLAAIAAQAADIFKTTGFTLSLLTYFNLGLSPLLLLLPITLLSWTSQAAYSVRLVLMILLLVKVVVNWRESLELVYKFSKMQSALVMYATSAICFLLLLVTSYVILFNRVAAALS